jgi:hypothetical protein
VKTGLGLPGGRYKDCVELDRVRGEVGVVLGIIAPMFVAGLLVGVRDVVQNATIALVLVVVVVLAAAVGGRRAGVCAAVVSALSFDFFHTTPYLRLTIDTADDMETTFLLLVVALVVGHIVAGSRRAQASADERHSDIWRIHRVAEQAARGAEAADVILAAQEELAELLVLRSCRFEAQPLLPVLPRLERSGYINSRVLQLRDEGFELPLEGVELPVYGRGQQLGRFVLEPTPGVGVSLERRVVAVAVADQVGAVLVPGLT